MTNDEIKELIAAEAKRVADDAINTHVKRLEHWFGFFAKLLGGVNFVVIIGALIYLYVSMPTQVANLAGKKVEERVTHAIDDATAKAESVTEQIVAQSQQIYTSMLNAMKVVGAIEELGRVQDLVRTQLTELRLDTTNITQQVADLLAFLRSLK